MARDTDVVVIGAGVVGLACAAALARAGHGVVILERHAAIAQETTTRNSEVIHAGIYYPEGSLKARLCVEGRTLLYERCEKQGIPHRRIGKLIVATCDAEVETLEAARKVPIPEKKEEQLKYVSRVLSVVNDIHLLFEGIWSSFEREILMIRELGGDITKAESLLRTFQERYRQHNYLGALESAHSMDEAINYAKKEYFQNGAPMILSS